MLKAELLEIITNGENSGVEFKRDDIRPEQLAKEIVAFAYFQGGVNTFRLRSRWAFFKATGPDSSCGLKENRPLGGSGIVGMFILQTHLLISNIGKDTMRKICYRGR